MLISFLTFGATASLRVPNGQALQKRFVQNAKYYKHGKEVTFEEYCAGGIGPGSIKASTCREQKSEAAAKVNEDEVKKPSNSFQTPQQLSDRCKNKT
jgi:hypothetical protein